MRGASAAVAGYDGYSWGVGGQGPEIFFGQPVELLAMARAAASPAGPLPPLL